jgi:hypothetical protein
MFYQKPITFITIFVFLAMIFGCNNKSQVNPKLNAEMPKKILWAWERPEDLRFLDVPTFGVAFLAQTLNIQEDEVIFRPRRQPLELPPDIYLIAVTRIETIKENSKRPTLSEDQRKKIVNLVKKTLELPNVKAVQIDFDVVVSERNFYRELIKDLRQNIPENTPLTMTSLASWCVGDSWFNDFSVDEAVPMAFEMGADDKSIRDFFAKDNDWREPLCRGSYGISIDDPVKINFKPERRIYYFKSRAWEKRDLDKLN